MDKEKVEEEEKKVHEEERRRRRRKSRFSRRNRIVNGLGFYTFCGFEVFSMECQKSSLPPSMKNWVLILERFLA